MFPTGTQFKQTARAYRQLLLNNAVYVFTVSAATAIQGDVYSDSNSNLYTVASSISGGTKLVTTGTSATYTVGTTTLTKVSGSGDATITFSASVVHFKDYIAVYNLALAYKLTPPVLSPFNPTKY